MVKTSSSNAGSVGLIPDKGVKIINASQPKKKTQKLKRSNIATNSIKTLKNSPH